MRIQMLFGLAVSGMVALAAPSGYAASCNRTASSAQFDSFYGALWGCQQSEINDMWSRYGFDQSDWTGLGYEDVCNDDLPLKRTFNALQLLAYGVTATPSCSTGWSNVGLWAYCWAGNSIDELDGRCGESARATTHVGFGDNSTELYSPFFYDETVVQRAATIFHEARHADGWCSHTSSCPDGGNSCDPSWDGGCVGAGSGSGVGANAYTVVYLSWFAVTARSGWINDTIVDDAVAEATRYLNRRFGVDPCFRLDTKGYAYATC